MTVFFVRFTNAQENGNKRVNRFYGNWSLAAGINAVDDSGTKGANFFNTEENWNSSSPFTASIEYYIDNQWSVSVTGSVNKYVSGKNIDSTGVIVQGYAADYLAVDLATKLSLGDLFSSYAFDPYIFIGFGYNQIGSYKLDPFFFDLPVDLDVLPDEINGIPIDENGYYDIPEIGKITLNGGAGFNYWFAKTWGVNFNFTAKFAIESGEFKLGPNSVSDQAQFSLSLMYFFKKK